MFTEVIVDFFLLFQHFNIDPRQIARYRPGPTKVGLCRTVEDGPK